MASKDPAECTFLSPIGAERYLTCPERRLATSDCTSVQGGSGPLYGLNGICVIRQSETKPVAAATVNARDDDSQNPVRTSRRADRFKHESKPTLAQHELRTYFRAPDACRTKNFHLSMPAATATSKNPTIISSEV